MSLSPELRGRLTGLVESDPVVLFMKGSRVAPQCGFSAATVEILDRLLAEYATVDVLTDPDVREGIKEFSDWPTIPQLYVRGEFVGGSDIVKEMYGKGELHDALGLSRPEPIVPKIAVTERAADALRGAVERSPEASLHLVIDARLQCRIGIGPRQAAEVVVESSGLTFLLDAETAARSDGITIDVTDSPGGLALSVTHSNGSTARG
jgi:monothiol glutaredoxin